MNPTITLLGGRLKLESSPHGNPPEDALWLATSVTPPPPARVLDAMCGTGVVGLALLTREPTLHLTALDINPTLTAAATRNAALNGFQANHTTLT
ncbi:MAG: methyltransferase, partial [Alphaproteobacteria bacterium]